MNSPLMLHCLCGHTQAKVLEVTEYELVIVTPGCLYCDFEYCEECLAPIAFRLPPGIVKRSRDRYSEVLVVVEALRRAG